MDEDKIRAWEWDEDRAIGGDETGVWGKPDEPLCRAATSGSGHGLGTTWLWVCCDGEQVRSKSVCFDGVRVEMRKGKERCDAEVG